MSAKRFKLNPTAFGDCTHSMAGNITSKLYHSSITPFLDKNVMTAEPTRVDYGVCVEVYNDEPHEMITSSKLITYAEKLTSSHALNRVAY